MSANHIFIFFLAVSFLFCYFVSYDKSKLCWICTLPPLILSAIHSFLLTGRFNGYWVLAYPLTLGFNLVAALVGGIVGLLLAKLTSNNKSSPRRMG